MLGENTEGCGWLYSGGGAPGIPILPLATCIFLRLAVLSIHPRRAFAQVPMEYLLAIMAALAALVACLCGALCMMWCLKR